MVPLPHTVIEVETMAARRALELAAELGFDNLVFEGGSQVLINVLKSGTCTLAQYGHLAKDIIFLALHFSVLKFSHLCRIGNKVAHSLTCRVITSRPCQSGWKMYLQTYFLYYRLI